MFISRFCKNRTFLLLKSYRVNIQMSNKSYTSQTNEILRCNLCRRSYKKGKNHVYSSGHVENLRKALTKFTSKIIYARSQLDCPVIKAEDSSDDKHAKFWCYFCSKEISKHVVFDNRIYLENAGLLEHISGAKHLLMAKAFWRNNRLNKKYEASVDKKAAKTMSVEGVIEDRICGQSIMHDYYRDMRNSCHSDITSSLSRSKWLKQQVKVGTISQVSLMNNGEEKLEKEKRLTKIRAVSPELKLDSFILSEGDLQRFINNSKQCVDRFFAESDEKLSQDAKLIASSSKSRSLVLDYFRRQMSYSAGSFGQNGLEKSRTPSTSKMPGPGPGPVRTVSAYGEGLTCIGIPKVDEAVGNIYSDAPPPWLQPTTDERKPGSSVNIIGPTVDDLKKHLERQKKLKLPATRVGADFNHQDATRITDLPSFGGVWSKNRRSHQQAGFKKTWNHQGAQTFRHGVRSSAWKETVGNVLKDGDKSVNFDGLGVRKSNQLSSVHTPLNAKLDENPMPKLGGYQRKRTIVSQSNVTSFNTGDRLNISSNLL